MAGKLREAFDESVAANDQIVAKVDAAAIAAGRAIADEIDFAIENFEGQERTKALYLTPHLMNILKEMLATPAARKAVGLAGKAEGAPSTLGRLRSVHSGKGA